MTTVFQKKHTQGADKEAKTTTAQDVPGIIHRLVFRVLEEMGCFGREAVRWSRLAVRSLACISI